MSSKTFKKLFFIMALVMLIAFAAMFFVDKTEPKPESESAGVISDFVKLNKDIEEAKDDFFDKHPYLKIFRWFLPTSTPGPVVVN